MKNAPTPGPGTGPLRFANSPAPKNGRGGTGQRSVRYLDGVFEADFSRAIVGLPPIFISLLRDLTADGKGAEAPSRVLE
jgi:hypothetical protein